MTKQSASHTNGAAEAARHNLALDQALVDEAKALSVSVSGSSNEELAAAVQAARWGRWLEENRPALYEWNSWVEKNGLPLAKYRLF